MANLNKVMLIGNLCAKPELRYTPKGTAVTELRLATNRTWRDNEGNKQEEATFLDITVWGQQAEHCETYLSKGRPIFVEGRLVLDTWEDKDTGKNRSRLKIVGERIQFLPSGGQRPTPENQPTGQPAPPTDPPEPSGDASDDIPF